MALDQRVLGLIDLLYAAALDDRRWPESLRALAEFTASQGATFWVLDGSTPPRLPLFTYINFDPAFVQEYLDHVAPLDPTVQYLVRHPEQSLVHDGLVIGDREKDRHLYYDWHRRGSDTEFRLVARAHPSPVVQAGVALHRTRKAGRFEPADIARFSVLYPHLERALRIGCRLGSLGARQQCTEALLDRQPNGVVLLDERQRVVYANGRAAALGSAGDGIRLTASGIVLDDRSDHDRLRAAIERVLAGAAAAGPLRVHRPSGRTPYAILVAPVSREYPALSEFRPAVCLVLSDPDDQDPLPADRLQAAFELTGAEARLAARLADGESLRAAAESLGITYETARSRLAVIFQKTGTHRQAELIRLLLTTLAGR